MDSSEGMCLAQMRAKSMPLFHCNVISFLEDNKQCEAKDVFFMVNRRGTPYCALLKKSKQNLKYKEVESQKQRKEDRRITMRLQSMRMKPIVYCRC